MKRAPGILVVLLLALALGPVLTVSAERKPKKRTGPAPATNAAPAAPTPAPAPTPAASPAPTASGSIKVVRPNADTRLTASEGYTYVIGTIPSDQYTLRCNGKLCDVYTDGTFIGYIPIVAAPKPVTVDGKVLNAVFEFSAARGAERLTNVVYCMTPSSPSAPKPSAEKFLEPRVMESTQDQWVALENTPSSDGKALINAGKAVFFPKGTRVSVKEKRDHSVLMTDLIEQTPVWIPEAGFKPVQEAPPTVQLTEQFQIERLPKSTIYRFETGAPLPLLFDETTDRGTLRLRFVTSTPKAFVLPQPEKIWGYDAAYQNGVYAVTVRNAPEVDPKKPLQGIRIMIDPGHYPDPGIVGPRGTQESTMSLLLSKQVAETLRQQGAIVELSRDDRTKEHKDRTEAFRAFRPDLLLSIHFGDLGENEDPKTKWGTQCIYLMPHSFPLAKILQRALAGTVQGHDLSFAQRSMVSTLYPAAPSVVIESTHLVMPEEEKRLLTQEFREQLAKTISEGVTNFLLGETRGSR